MKRSILMILAMAAMAAGCDRPELDVDIVGAKDNVIVAEMETGVSATTKTHMQKVDNGVYRTMWSEKDRIGVVDQEGNLSTFTLESGAGTNKGTFAGQIPDGQYVAYYPFENAYAYDASSQIFAAILPEVQTYKEDSFDDGAYPMIAVSEDASVSFKNLCSVLRVSLKGTQTVKAIYFSAASEKNKVSGMANISAAWTSAPEILYIDGSNVVKLDCGSGVKLDRDNATHFHIVIPAQKYEGGFSLKIVTDKGEMMKSTANDVIMERSQLRAIPAFDLEVSEEIEWKRVYGPHGEEYGHFVDDIITSLFGLGSCAENHKVEVYERTDMPGYYRFDNIYSAEVVAWMFYEDPSRAEECSEYVKDCGVIVDASLPSRVHFPLQQLGAMMNKAYGWMEAGSLNEDNGFMGENEYGMMNDGVISFPIDGLVVGMPEYDSGYYYANQNGRTMFILPGMDRTLIYEIGESEDGMVPVSVDMGYDLSAVRIAVADGELTDAQIQSYAEDVISGSVDYYEMTEEGKYEISGKSTGFYTLVLVGYDTAGEPVKITGEAFGYTGAGDDMPVTIGYERVFKDEWYAEGYTPANMIGVRIYGQDITWFYAILYDMSVIRENSPEAIKEAMMSYSSMNGEEALKQVNSTGYVAGFIGLDPGTTYCLAICAGNGYKTELFLYEVVTESTDDPLKDVYNMDKISRADKSAYCGTWTFYASVYGETDERVGISYVTVEDAGSEEVEEGDVREYFYVSGLFFTLVEDGLLDTDRMLWEYYDGYIMPLHDVFGELTISGSKYEAATLGVVGDATGYADMGILGGFTADGNIAFVDTGVYSDYGPYTSYMLFALQGDQSVGYLVGYNDMMFLPGPTKAALDFRKPEVSLKTCGEFSIMK